MSDQEEEYEVEFIIGKRKKKGKIQYLVKWKGWDRPEDNSWKYLKDLHCNDLIEDFNATAEAKAKAKLEAKLESKNQMKKLREAEDKKQKEKEVDVDVRRKVPPGPKERKTRLLGFDRGLTAEKIVSVGRHPADGELFHLVKVSSAQSILSYLN